MIQPTFTARIEYENTESLAAEIRRGVTVPAGVEARNPIFRTLAQLVEIKQARGRRFNYSNVRDISFAAGFTDTDLTVSFANFGRSWQREGDTWQFCGGEIVLTCSIGIYVDERASAAARRRCLQMILTHELLHVRDEIDLVTNWLPGEALNDAFVRANVSDQARIPAAQFETRIRGAGDGSGSDLERRIQRELYLRESSDRAEALHESRPQDTRAISRCMRGA